MSGFAGGVLYLATPLGAVLPPAVVELDPVERPLPRAEAGTARPPSPTFLPIARPVEGGTLGDVIAGEIRRLADEPAGVGRGAEPQRAEAHDPGALDAEVAAEHGARVAAIARRLDDAVADGAAAASLGDLRLRLRRAEAARRLALARVAAGPPGMAERREVVLRAAPASARSEAPRLLAPADGGGSVADRLAGARRSLAKARRLLEPVEVAGLWTWPGSGSWSLADYPARG